MTRPRPVLILACILAALVCLPVFFAAHFAASVLIYRLQEVAGIGGLSPGGAAGLRLFGEFLGMLAAMGMTYATFAGLRWVWQGTNLSRK